VKIIFKNALTLIFGEGCRTFRFCNRETQHS